MSIQLLTSAPQSEDFTPLQQHQEQTPQSFFGAKPVLHAHYADVTLSTATGQLQQDAAFSKFGTRREGEEELVEGVEIWVSSDNLIFFQTEPTPVGVSIPYPLLALHATMKYKTTIEALYINISLNDAESVNDDDDIHMLEMTVLPPAYTSRPSNTIISELFAALNTCADLHPDPNDSDEDGEDLLDDSASGASGWITAENMDEYMDENGNFSGMVIGDELGPGAGTVRTRDNGDEGTDGVNGVDGHSEKIYRTE